MRTLKLPATLIAKVESIHGNNTLAEVRSLKGRAMEISQQAQDAGDRKTALLGIREARLCLKAESRFTSQQAQSNVLNANKKPSLFDKMAEYEKRYRAEYITEQLAALEPVYRGETLESKMSDAVEKELSAQGMAESSSTD